ncbi:hypothetical protein [Thalassoporum mexicanum]
MADNTELDRVDALAAQYFDALTENGSQDPIKTKIVGIILAAEVVLKRERSFFEQKLVDEVWADITGAELDVFNIERHQPRPTDVALGSSDSASSPESDALLKKLIDDYSPEL